MKEITIIKLFIKTVREDKDLYKSFEDNLKHFIEKDSNTAANEFMKHFFRKPCDYIELDGGKNYLPVPLKIKDSTINYEI